MRKVVGYFARNGFFYTLNRVNGTPRVTGRPSNPAVSKKRRNADRTRFRRRSYTCTWCQPADAATFVQRRAEPPRPHGCLPFDRVDGKVDRTEIEILPEHHLCGPRWLLSGKAAAVADMLHCLSVTLVV
jgi:hypothetical protein